jgi:hypothetical protein
MKKTTSVFIILFLACALIFSSCKKTNINNTLWGNTGQLKSMTQIVASGGQNDTITTTFAYDIQNRVVLQIAVTKQGSTLLGIDTVTYTYNATTVVQYMSATGVSVTYTLNSQGYKQSDNLGDSWTYNTAGYMIGAVVGTSTKTYAYNGLNQLITQTSVTGGVTNTYSYTYASNPIGKAGSSWSQGQSTGDLPDSEVEVQSGVTTTLTYTYQANSQGALTAETVTSSATGSSPVYTYFIYY